MPLTMGWSDLAPPLLVPATCPIIEGSAPDQKKERRLNLTATSASSPQLAGDGVLFLFYPPKMGNYIWPPIVGVARLPPTSGQPTLTKYSAL